MQKIFPLLLLNICLACISKNSNISEKLADELDSIMIVDQKYRGQIQAIIQESGTNSPQVGELWMKQNEIDQSNLKRIIEILDSINIYPGKTMVGKSASKATFLVLQHAPDSVQEKYYDLITNAAEENELDKELAAMYRDRYYMHRGKPQIFGTQIRPEYRIDSITGERISKLYVWPIADTTNIDSLRLRNGLGPLEDYLNRYGISRWK